MKTDNLFRKHDFSYVPPLFLFLVTILTLIDSIQGTYSIFCSAVKKSTFINEIQYFFTVIKLYLHLQPILINNRIENLTEKR